MWELLIPAAALVLERIWDYSKRARQTTDDLVRKVTRAAMPKVIAMAGKDKDQASRLLINLVETGLRAVGITPSKKQMDIVRSIFAQLWEMHARDSWNDSMAQLAAAGVKASKIVNVLESIKQ